jgi:hypothetical protein
MMAATQQLVSFCDAIRCDSFAKTYRMAKQKFRPTRPGGFSGAKAYIESVEKASLGANSPLITKFKNLLAQIQPTNTGRLSILVLFAIGVESALEISILGR